MRLAKLAVKSSGDSARDAPQRVGITAKRNGQPDCIFVVFGVEKSRDRFGHGTLAGFVKRVSRPDARYTSAQIITKLLFYRVPDFIF